jgi:O-methyltransferase involved in polyketide biosynthesis
LVIAEGVIPYFSNADVASLAEDLSSIPSFRRWILDFDNAGKRRMPRGWDRKLQAAPFRFSVDNWFEFFKHAGWRPRKVITSAEESERFNRPCPFPFPWGLIMRALPELRRKVLTVSGAVLMEKNAAPPEPDGAAAGGP